MRWCRARARLLAVIIGRAGVENPKCNGSSSAQTAVYEAIVTALPPGIGAYTYASTEIATGAILYSLPTHCDSVLPSLSLDSVVWVGLGTWVSQDSS